jgi:Uma2 family endonuclease
MTAIRFPPPDTRIEREEADTPHYYSADEFFEISQRPEYEGRRLTLLHGRIIEEKGVNGVAGGTSGPHGEVTSILTWHVNGFVFSKKLGRTTGAETCYVLYKHPTDKKQDVVQCPDFAFVTLARAPQPFSEGYIPYAPDLAVEVVSPGNTAAEIDEKVRQYLKYGTRIVWIVYPASKSVTVHTPSGARSLDADGRLEGGDLLPDFALRVTDIFPT